MISNKQTRTKTTKILYKYTGKNTMKDVNLEKNTNSLKEDPNNKFDIQVPTEEWEYIKKYIKTNPDIKKIRRKDNHTIIDKQGNKIPLSHSFIILKKDKNSPSTIVAIRNGVYIGEGANGKVKVGITKDNTKLAIKIEQPEKDLNIDPCDTIAAKILTKLYRWFGAVKQNNKVYTGKKIAGEMDLVDALKNFEKENVNKYTGKKPEAFLQLNFSNLTTEQKLVLGYKIAKTIQSLHDQNILHLDIHTKNLMVSSNNDIIEVHAIDFDFSAILKEGQTEIVFKNPRGTAEYMTNSAKMKEYDTSMRKWLALKNKQQKYDNEYQLINNKINNIVNISAGTLESINDYINKLTKITDNLCEKSREEIEKITNDEETFDEKIFNLFKTRMKKQIQIYNKICNELIENAQLNEKITLTKLKKTCSTISNKENKQLIEQQKKIKANLDKINNYIQKNLKRKTLFGGNELQSAKIRIKEEASAKITPEELEDTVNNYDDLLNGTKEEIKNELIKISEKIDEMKENNEFVKNFFTLYNQQNEKIIEKIKKLDNTLDELDKIAQNRTYSKKTDIFSFGCLLTHKGLLGLDLDKNKFPILKDMLNEKDMSKIPDIATIIDKLKEYLLEQDVHLAISQKIVPNVINAISFAIDKGNTKILKKILSDNFFKEDIYKKINQIEILKQAKSKENLKIQKILSNKFSSMTVRKKSHSMTTLKDIKTKNSLNKIPDLVDKTTKPETPKISSKKPKPSK